VRARRHRPHAVARSAWSHAAPGRRANERRRPWSQRCHDATTSTRSSSSAPGPIVIGQAAEFDYSGTQACKALRSAGYEVVLINANPATIMTDPEVADRTYVEPLTPEFVEMVIRAERPDALLPTLGGQTALNLAKVLHETGVLERHGVRLIGANYDAIHKGEDRQAFQQAMARIGLKTPMGKMVGSLDEALAFVGAIGYPAIIRPSFTLGGTGGGIAYDEREFRGHRPPGPARLPVHTVLVEQSVLGWKEYELEVMRDVNDTVVIICSIENFDPMGSTRATASRSRPRRRSPTRSTSRCATTRSRSSARSASTPAARTSSSPSTRTTAT
jgi:carbamoylphosphate synthase large subunit